MNGVWLNDDLMVSPSAVAGLRASHVTSGMPPEWWYVVDVLFVGGSQARVAEVREQPEAQAEIERLSELLWPAAPYQAAERPASMTVGDPEPDPFALKHDDGVPVEFANPAMMAASGRAAEVGVLKPPFSVRRSAAKVAWLALCAVVDEWVATGDRSPAGEQVPLRECRHPQWRESDGYTVECDLLVGHDGAHRFPR